MSGIVVDVDGKVSPVTDDDRVEIDGKIYTRATVPLGKPPFALATGMCAYKKDEICSCGDLYPCPWDNSPKLGLDATLAERGARYGDYTDHAQILDDLLLVMVNAAATGKLPGKAWDDLLPIHRQALRVIADKIARVLNGDPNYKDNWHDIQGYAKLVEDRCR